MHTRYPFIIAMRVPMFKDPVFMAELRRSFINDHNRKIEAKKSKSVLKPVPKTPKSRNEKPL